MTRLIVPAFPVRSKVDDVAERSQFFIIKSPVFDHFKNVSDTTCIMLHDSCKKMNQRFIQSINVALHYGFGFHVNKCIELIAI